MKVTIKAIVSVTALLTFLVSATHAADKERVVPCPSAKISDVIITPTADMPCDGGSGIGFSFGAFGGVEQSENFGGVNATMMLPISDVFTTQIDGAIGITENDAFFGQVVGHSLMHTESAAFGVYSSYSFYDSDPAVSRLGGEFSIDTNSISLAAIGGWQSHGKNNLFVDTKIGLQLGDNAQAYAGYVFDDISIGKVGFELAVFNTASLTAEARLGEGDYKSASLGLQFNFGGQSCQNPNSPQKASGYSKFSNQFLLPRKARQVAAGPRVCTPAEIFACDYINNPALMGCSGPALNPATCSCSGAIACS